MIWDKPICTADGEATPEQLEAAWQEWRSGRGTMTATGLVGCLRRAGATSEVRYWQFYRLADRMLQRARRSGEIAYDKHARKWVLR